MGHKSIWSEANSMERMEQLTSLAAESLQKRFILDLDQIMNTLKDNAEQITLDLLNTLHCVFDQAGELQKAGAKGPLAYISFSMLQSNLLLGKFSFQVDAYDERFLLDDNETAFDWDFSLLLQNVKQDFETVGALLRKSIVRVQEYELYELKKSYQMNYYSVAVGVLQQILPLCLKQLLPCGIKLSPEIQFTFGSYMENQMSFYQWRQEE